MRAAFIEALGGPEQLRIGERPSPEPGGEQVLVRVRSAGVGFWDVKIMAGVFGNARLPYVPGLEVAGVVEAAATGFQVGDAVFGRVSIRGGGLAELVVLEPGRLARKPARASFDEAGGLVTAAGAALEALVDRARLQAGETLLITAAAGGVGSMAVQIGANAAARVIGVARARHHSFLRSLGAAEAFDYTDADWVNQVRHVAPSGVDVMLDCVGGATLEQAMATVRDGGRVVCIAGAPDRVERGISVDNLNAQTNAERLQRVADLFDEGKLQIELDHVFAFEQAAEALARVASRQAQGKVVVRVTPQSRVTP